MGNKIKILADSTCDLPPEVVEKYDIGIIPLYVIMDDKSYRDGIDTNSEALFEYSNRTKTTPKTAAASVADFIDVFKPYVEEGCDIICFGISSKFSSTIQNAEIAAKEFPQAKIFAYDSYNLSTGIGLQVMYACELRNEGMDAAEIVKKLEEIRPKVRASFVVDVMTFLHRGGRCSALTAVGASVLQIHPQIVVEDGMMHPDKKYRGNIIKSACAYADDLLQNIERIDPRRVFVTCSSKDMELINAVKSHVESKGYFKEVLWSLAGSTVASHCGPKIIGVLFIEK